MFGFSALKAAIVRLTAAFNDMAAAVEETTVEARQRVGLHDDQPEPVENSNGRKRIGAK